jgi:hypothetical protein
MSRGRWEGLPILSRAWGEVGAGRRRTAPTCPCPGKGWWRAIAHRGQRRVERDGAVIEPWRGGEDSGATDPDQADAAVAAVEIDQRLPVDLGGIDAFVNEHGLHLGVGGGPVYDLLEIVARKHVVTVFP